MLHFASILGIRPAAFDFGTVTIAPQLGTLTNVSGMLVHARGEIEVHLRTENGKLWAQITLLEGLRGTFVYGAQPPIALAAGSQELELATAEIEAPQ